MKSKTLIVLLFITGILASSCVKKRLDDRQIIPPNVRTYYHSKKVVWRNLVQIIRNEYLIPFDYASYRNGNFACQEVKNADDPNFKTKVRLSGSLTFDGSGTVVSLFKYVEYWNEKSRQWASLPSDFLLETQILNRLGERLGDNIPKKK